MKALTIIIIALALAMPACLVEDSDGNGNIPDSHLCWTVDYWENRVWRCPMENVLQWDATLWAAYTAPAHFEAREDIICAWSEAPAHGRTPPESYSWCYTLARAEERLAEYR